MTDWIHYKLGKLEKQFSVFVLSRRRRVPCVVPEVRAVVERVAIRLEGQVELILFPLAHPHDTSTGEEYQFVLGSRDYLGDEGGVALSSPPSGTLRLQSGSDWTERLVRCPHTATTKKGPETSFNSAQLVCEMTFSNSPNY